MAKKAKTAKPSPSPVDWAFTRSPFMRHRFLEDPDRIVFVQTKLPPLTPDQVGQALGALKSDDPVWRAVLQLIDERIAAAVLDNSNANLAEARVRAAGGAVEALSDLKRALYIATGQLSKADA